MVYHIPSMLRKYGNLRQFSGQGMLVQCDYNRMSAPIDIDNTFLLCIIILLHEYVWITLSNIQNKCTF